MSATRTRILILGGGFGGVYTALVALVSDSPRSATVRSRTAVNVLTVDREAFHALFGSLPPLRGVFQDLIEQRR